MQAPELALHEGAHLLREEAIKETDEWRHQWSLMSGAISGHQSSRS